MGGSAVAVVAQDVGRSPTGKMSHTSIAVGLVVLLTACGATGASPSTSLTAGASSSASPSPTASGEPSTAPSATHAGPSVAPTPSPGAGVQPVQPDVVVETVVEGLTVRREAGISGQRIGILSLGTLAYVLAGPMEADGLPWYRIVGMGLPYASGCPTTPPDVPITCPAFQGWVAGASDAGDPWLAPAVLDVCAEPDLRTISEIGSTWRLYCWADEPITFEAWWPEIPDDAGPGEDCPESDRPSGWLYCQHVNDNGLAASPEEGFVNRLQLSIDPASSVAMPDRGQWIRVTGVFDHPAAAACAELANSEWEDSFAAVLKCRLEFVPTSVEPLGS